ncbi:zinc-dependent alcohol dehydrogenase [Paenibacillus radicis (ex Xue et al. 2023)]|uniref:Alcohol dehydrogenase catalytic domain-containing protein n=1 Tax=Paenibacillus radicis (ex Xue et al. 2023) TaxID=2972489 RepID=A0ABT1YA36_9BACL|nr:alcohol dehydrogenase catalytic domain-containing protein [Paenibacillus radicis (ex Xue et al. 2023)]MCR8630037.1 alcohol dehydrogenase catalytic domain-containing protein [Paenibacillus radicis (ex Xue et al. 2023)]
MAVMKAGLYISEKQVMVGQIEIPDLQPGEALIKVAYAGICGTDMMIYSGKHPRAQAPLAMGHEFSGVIERINGESSFAVGNRVVVEPTLSCGTCAACMAGEHHVCKTLKLIGIDKHGGFAEYAAVPLDRLHLIPEGLSDAHAALAEPVAVAVHTVRRSNLKIGDSVVILGAGPIGLLIGAIAKHAGASEVIISDISEYRLEKAKQLGLTPLNAKDVNITEDVLKRTGGNGADVVFEVAGNQITAKQMIETVRTQGQVVVVSVYKQPPMIDLAAMHFREISLTTTRCYSKGDFAKAIRLMHNGAIDVSSFISHDLPLDRIEEGFQFMSNPDVSLKVLFHP